MVQAVRRWLLRIGVGLLVVIVLWLGVCYQVLQHPTVDKPTPADAVVVLGGPTDNRMTAALSLLSQGLSHQLVVSGADRNLHLSWATCQSPPAGVTVSCFHPDPSTTRGEAEFVGRLATEYGWRTIIVVTSRYHVSRARLIFDRCFSGRIEMVAGHENVSFTDWAYQYVYQSAGYLKAFTHQSC
jgi:uncharacterized SAM-binding protein YcdF (DUF218 family)